MELYKCCIGEQCRSTWFDDDGAKIAAIRGKLEQSPYDDQIGCLDTTCATIRMGMLLL